MAQYRKISVTRNKREVEPGSSNEFFCGDRWDTLNHADFKSYKPILIYLADHHFRRRCEFYLRSTIHAERVYARAVAVFPVGQQRF